MVGVLSSYFSKVRSFGNEFGSSIRGRCVEARHVSVSTAPERNQELFVEYGSITKSFILMLLHLVTVSVRKVLRLTKSIIADFYSGPA